MKWGTFLRSSPSPANLERRMRESVRLELLTTPGHGTRCTPRPALPSGHQAPEYPDQPRYNGENRGFRRGERQGATTGWECELQAIRASRRRRTACPPSLLFDESNDLRYARLYGAGSISR